MRQKIITRAANSHIILVVYKVVEPITVKDYITTGFILEVIKSYFVFWVINYEFSFLLSNTKIGP